MLALTTASLLFAESAAAETYTEVGDAGDLPAIAQIVPGVPGTTVTAIAGMTTAINGLYDSDMYQLTIALAGTYTFSTNTCIVGRNNSDTQLALCKSNGVGIVANDDVPIRWLAVMTRTAYRSR